MNIDSSVESDIEQEDYSKENLELNDKDLDEAYTRDDIEELTSESSDDIFKPVPANCSRTAFKNG